MAICCMESKVVIFILIFSFLFHKAQLDVMAANLCVNIYLILIMFYQKKYYPIIQNKLKPLQVMSLLFIWNTHLLMWIWQFWMQDILGLTKLHLLEVFLEYGENLLDLPFWELSTCAWFLWNCLLVICKKVLHQSKVIF